MSREDLSTEELLSAEIVPAEDKNWWTVRIDYVPGRSYICGSSENRRTRKNRRYVVLVTDYADVDEAIGELFQKIRDTFDRVI